jgi:hypothetical protein
MFMAEVTDECGSDDAKAVGDGGVEVGKADQQGQKAGIHQRDPSIDKVAFEIFLPAIASGMKHDIFVAEEGVGESDDSRGDDENEIVDTRIQKIVKSRINEGSKDRVPSAHGKIPQGLVLRCAEKSEQVIY